MATLLHQELFVISQLYYFIFNAAQSITTVTSSQVQLYCTYRVQSNGIIIWSSLTPSPILPLSENTKIYNTVPTELRQRLNITGDHSNGEHNLMISDVKKTDEGQYKCEVYGHSDKEKTHQLIVIEGPTSVNISNKKDNTIPGTEDHALTIKCTANGGDPAPNMKLTIGNDAYTVTNKHTIENKISKINRSYNGVTVTCQAGYDGVAYTPQTDTAVIRLDLKPLIPSFSMNPVVTDNTQSLIMTCTSTGSRPSPTEWIWLIGDRNVDITSNSTSVSSSQQSDGTFTASSTLNFKVHKDFNRQLIKCGFKNTASGNNYVQNSTTVEVRYAPDISVQNKTFTLTLSFREINCDADGNPASSFSKWQHKSKYGELIRQLDGNSTLVLPQQSEKGRYQDTGEYVCTASNGISDKDGILDQQGSGYVISQAPPRFLNGSSQTKLGQYGRNVDIDVSVYSVPKYNTLTWMRDGIQIKQSNKYRMSDVSDVITDTFYGTTIQVDGFKIILTISNLLIQDFDNYTLRLSNRVGDTVEHLVVLISASPPETPTNFTILGSTDSTVLLQWQPAFDGGHEQSFVVEYRRKDSGMWKSAIVSKELIILQDELQSYELPGLKDSTSYELRMYAENKFNKSKPTQIEIISTKEGSHSSGQGAVIGAAVGSLTVIFVILAIVAVVVVRRKKVGKSTKEILRSDSEMDEEGGLKDNILYKSVDTGSKIQVSSEYAEVQKPNDVYAEVNKPKTQKNNKDKKPKGKKLQENKKQKSKDLQFGDNGIVFEDLEPSIVDLMVTNITAVNNNSADVYANQSEYAKTESPGGYKNADGLQYADLTFSNLPKTKTGKSAIHGLDDRTIYCDVDHTKKAPLPPQEGAYELTVISQGKK